MSKQQPQPQTQTQTQKATMSEAARRTRSDALVISIMIFLLKSSVTLSKHVADDQQGHHQRRGSMSAMIIGGSPSISGDFPFYAATDGFRGSCGATLIHEDILLTVAHCHSADDAFEDGVYIGGTVIYPVPDGTFAAVDSWLVHPQHDATTLKNDIMLIKLTNPSTAPIVQLNYDASIPKVGDPLTVIGYGVTESGVLADDLLQVTVPYVDPSDCLRSWDSVLCAGNLAYGGMDACHGDSGGPLLTEDNVQVGIVSQGNDCGLPSNPGVYTRVSSFESFIKTGVCELSSNPPSDCLLAYDMVGSTSYNLISYSNEYTEAFSESDDGFQKYSRSSSAASIPPILLDDSLHDSHDVGVIPSINMDEFFGMADTNNPDNNGGDVEAEWVFDITGATALTVCIDMAAYGSFETSSDDIRWHYSIDGLSDLISFTLTPDESYSVIYVMESGRRIKRENPVNPMTVTSNMAANVRLSNVPRTVCARLDGRGRQLTLALVGSVNGANEGVIFQNIKISSLVPIAYDMAGRPSQNLISYTNAFTDQFSSSDDGFQKYKRGTSEIPSMLLDDTLIDRSYTGVVKSTNNHEFFGMVDTENADNSGYVSANWVFDIENVKTMKVCIDMATYGPFESNNDDIQWLYSIDGSIATALFTLSVDDSGTVDYYMENGVRKRRNGPMTITSASVTNAYLVNTFETFCSNLDGGGKRLTLTLRGTMKGPDEAIAFQNIKVYGHL